MTNGWEEVPLGKLLKRADRFEKKDDLQTYHFAGTYSFARGIFAGAVKEGATFGLDKIQRIKKGDFIYCKIMAWEGAFGIAPEKVDNCVMSGAFVAYEVDQTQIYPKFLGYYFKQEPVWKSIGSQSTGTNVRRRSLHPNQFEKAVIPLPSLEEQLQIITYIEELKTKISSVMQWKSEINTDLDRILLAAYHKIADNSPQKPLEEVAPLTRRAAAIDSTSNYPQVAVRSFGRGTFHKPNLDGSEITWQKPYLVKTNDILISNIKAWEGAIAVANESDDGRFGSHRYLTCLPNPNVATSRFVCFHLLTEEGLSKIGEASPGTADRNRTLNTKALMKIPIPVPSIEQQLWFDELYAKISATRALQSATGEELSALLPSILDKAFKGEL